jgi:hypothetical protein
MPRGIAHLPELRDQVVAVVRTGASIGQAARESSLNAGLISRWVSAAPSCGVATNAGQGKQVPDSLAELTALIEAQLRQALPGFYNGERHGIGTSCRQRPGVNSLRNRWCASRGARPVDSFKWLAQPAIVTDSDP